MPDINVAASLDVGKNTQELIEKLAAQIGVTVDKVWPWLVRQQVIEGWTNLAVMVGALFLGVLCLLVGLVVFRRKGEKASTPFFMAGAALVVVSIFVLALGGSSQVQKIYNPEYFALKDLVYLVKP